MARPLHSRISTSLWRALEERSRTSGQSVNHIVQAALSEALDIEHHSIFQVSTSGALVRGLYQGCVSVADLRRHGDVGLGTFEDLDGEMILLDGHCYQARSDGSVVEAGDDALTPFAAVVNFAADRRVHLADVESFTDLTSRIDDLRVSPNSIVAIRATGTFRHLELRAACRTRSGIDLQTATANQSLFRHVDLAGTLVGFWSPEYAQSIAVSGHHLHFISADRSCGGHVLGLSSDGIELELSEVSDVHVAMPETEAFLEADLRGDNAEVLRRIEFSTGAGQPE